jgi:hypothetical protein
LQFVVSCIVGPAIKATRQIIPCGACVGTVPSFQRKRRQRRSYGEASTPGKPCCHVEKAPDRTSRKRETRTSTGTLRSLLDRNSTQCHVFCGRGWRPMLEPRHSRLKQFHADVLRTTHCTCERRVHGFHRTRRTLLEAVEALLSPEASFLSLTTTEFIGANEPRRISRCSLATNKLKGSFKCVSLEQLTTCSRTRRCYCCHWIGTRYDFGADRCLLTRFFHRCKRPRS